MAQIKLAGTRGNKSTNIFLASSESQGRDEQRITLFFPGMVDDRKLSTTNKELAYSTQARERTSLARLKHRLE